MLWEFIDYDGTFRVYSPEKTSRLYFPLANEAGLLSSITPDLHGDIKSGQNSFLTIPVSEQDLHLSRANRNFWVYIQGKGAWSATGVSCSDNKHNDKVWSEAGPLWHRVIRENKNLGLRAEITNFVPTGQHTIELMQVRLTNISRKPLKITPTSAVPIYGRSADNLRDHRHVTSLLHRIYFHKNGVIVTPTMSFDERGHKINTISYTVLGCEGNGRPPIGSFPTISEFIGEGGNLESPAVVIANTKPLKWKSREGQEAMGALRFKTINLAPSESVSYVLLLGISPSPLMGEGAVVQGNGEIKKWLAVFGTANKFETALTNTKNHWKERLDCIRFETGDSKFDNWLAWVTLQPTLRRLFGNSFLPDFDYGRGGRGWRDLWQDCLMLILTEPEKWRESLINNFAGVRIDGSNATIIGKKPGEFVADRNNIPRIWMDHGIWPLLTTLLYINQTGDFKILLEEAPYFNGNNDTAPSPSPPPYGERVGVRGTVLEHILVQHLVQFFNVGEHNIIRLLDADWNDGLDMARERGESVAFSAMYAGNLSALAGLLVQLENELKIKDVELSEELGILLDVAMKHPILKDERVTELQRGNGAYLGIYKKASASPPENYDSVKEKNTVLSMYFDKISKGLNTRKSKVSLEDLINDLSVKSQWLTEHIRKQEWIGGRGKLKKGWFNGYYDNNGQKVEGWRSKGVRITLTGQVFPVMAGVATEDQIKQIWHSVNKYLRDPVHKGFRLNSNFNEVLKHERVTELQRGNGAYQGIYKKASTSPPVKLDLGRAFAFAYGEKENGAFFNHMVVMFANSLYSRGFVKEGRDTLFSIYNMAANMDKSKIYPGLPEYFNDNGRGMYHYLTGSASWFILTYHCLVCGVRGLWGNLLLNPKFTADDFENGDNLTVNTYFAGKRLAIVYRNPKRLSFENYSVLSVQINRKMTKPTKYQNSGVVLDRKLLIDLPANKTNTIEVLLGHG